MNVLSIGTDRKIFEKGSAVRKRMIDYGTLFPELHIIVFALKSQGFQTEKISENVTVYSTQSSSRWAYIFDAITLGKHILSDKKAWVLTAQDPFETGLVGARLKKIFGVPLQIQIHTDFLSPYFRAHSFLNRLRVFVAGYTLPKADRIRVVSERIKNSLKAYTLKNEPQVLPIYVDREKIIDTPISTDLKQKYPQFTQHILMASRLTSEKNISFALQIFKKVLEQHPQTGLIIVGSGPAEWSLKEEVRKFNIEKSVIFEPWQHDIISYYKTATLFLTTSVYEGYGMTLIEAALSRCPIVTSDVGIAGSLLPKDTIAICSASDDTCFVEAISRLVQSEDKRKESADRAFEAAKSASLTHEKYLEMYRKLLIP